MEHLFTEVMKALALAFFIPLIAPVLRLVDTTRRRKEIKLQLEHIKLLAEMDIILRRSDAKERREFYRKTIDDIVDSSKELKYLNMPKGQDEGSMITKFGYLDMFVLLSLPATIFIMLVPQAKGVDQIAFSVITMVAAILSFFIGKYLISPFIGRLLLKRVLQILVAILSLIPGFMLASLFIN